MQLTQTQTSILEAARRTGAPLLLFSSVLTALLIASQTWLLPEVTKVTIGGEKRGMDDLRAYHASLQEQLVVMENERNTLILPVQDEQFVALIEKKHHVTDFLSIRSTLYRIADSFANEDGTPAVLLFGFDLNIADGQAEIRGDVRNVGTSSMTVLAQFTDAIRSLPRVKNVVNPRFVRETDANIGIHSPFVIRFSFLQ